MFSQTDSAIIMTNNPNPQCHYSAYEIKGYRRKTGHQGQYTEWQIQDTDTESMLDVSKLGGTRHRRKALAKVT